MSVIVVTGSRDWRDIGTIQRAMDDMDHRYPDTILTLRQGCASGADAIARSVAVFYQWGIHDYWPDYMSYDFAEANKKRNIAMLEAYPRPLHVLAFPTKNSRGTWHTINAAKPRGLDVIVYAES